MFASVVSKPLRSEGGSAQGAMNADYYHIPDDLRPRYADSTRDNGEQCSKWKIVQRSTCLQFVESEDDGASR